MIPKLFIMLGVLGLLSVIISLSVKNITHRRIVYVLFLIIIGTVSCSTSSSNDDELNENNTDTTAPTVTSVSTTADNQSSVSITDNITVIFSEAMDTTYVTTSTSDTNCAGTIRVSPDNFSTCVRMSSEPVSSNSNKTFTLDPYDNLTRLRTYLTRVTNGVKDTAGNAMGSQYETSSGFTTDNSSINVSNSGPTSGGTYSNGTTYYWKVVASDPKGGSAQSETWSFTVQE
ncbi:MAG: Ig-like domain-containing protein [Deltaproteobacteria bacterium]|nr:Ig-like domain-containing protein [Deltaproteobacteria bacterium]